MPAPVIAKPRKGLWQSVFLCIGGTDSRDQSADWSRNDEAEAFCNRPFILTT